MHVSRWSRRRDLHYEKPEHSHNWIGDAATYNAVHQRLRLDRGSAASWCCSGCSCPAAQWSYVGGDPNEKTDKSNQCGYSTDLDFYTPRCRACHVLADGWHGEGNPNAKLTRADVEAIREAVALGITTGVLAAQYDVSTSTIRLIVRRKRYGYVGVSPTGEISS